MRRNRFRAVLFLASFLAAAAVSAVPTAPMPAAPAQTAAPTVDPSWRIADVWVQIGADGSVVGVRLPAGQHRETGPMLAALAQTLRFEPATVDGRPVASGGPLRMYLADADPDGDGTVAVRVARAELSYGRLMKFVRPRYTASAGREAIAGVVAVQYDVDAEGRVIDDSVVPLSSEFHQNGSRYSGPIASTLQGAAVAAVRQWEFQVPRVGDEPLRLRAVSTVRFSHPRGSGEPEQVGEVERNEPLRLLDPRLRLPRLSVPTAPAR